MLGQTLAEVLYEQYRKLRRRKRFLIKIKRDVMGRTTVQP